MSGKSTYIRQVALIFLMCQIGSFVPASKAEITIADRIFTRVGASDNLAGGESTFMVEMTETANILNNATAASLVILDEVGRGTSTYDGVAIAWAIVEYIAKQTQARTLFATHYHELIQLEDVYPGVSNYNIKVIEENGKILFMHKIIPGGTDRSYGIHVAEIAGIPNAVIKHAHQILENLEQASMKKVISKAPKYIPAEQLSLAQVSPQSDKLSKEIKALNLDQLTPLEALNKLKELQEKAV